MRRRIETTEEAHFLVRIGTWTVEDLDDWYYRRWGGEFVDDDADIMDDYEYDKEVDGEI